MSADRLTLGRVGISSSQDNPLLLKKVSQETLAVSKKLPRETSIMITILNVRCIYIHFESSRHLLTANFYRNPYHIININSSYFLNVSR